MSQPIESFGLTDAQEARMQEAARLYYAEEFEQARAISDELLTEAPQDYSALHLGGVIAAAQKRLADAATLLNIAIQKAPDAPRAGVSWFGLARALRQAGDIRQAEEAYRRAVRLDPSACNYQLELAEVYVAGWKIDKAMETVQAAIKNFFYDPTPYTALGNVLHKCGRYEDALVAYDMAIARLPQYAAARMSRGSTLKVLGRFTESEQEIREALRLDPMIRGYMELVQIAKGTPTPEEIAAIKRRLDPEAKAPALARVDALFALSRLTERDGDYATAFKYLDEGCRTYRPTLDYKISEHQAMANGIIALFTPDFIARYERMSTSGLEPIFIVGMPRSGTTLTEQIIASHSTVQPGNELPFITMLARELGVTWESRGDAAPGDDATVAADLNGAAARYAEYTENLWKGKPHLTDKMPMNFFYVGIIHFLFPKAKIIYCRRNPAANCLSCLENLFAPGNLQFSYDQVEIAQFYKLHQQLMEHWNKVLPGRVLTVQYEELVQDHEAQVRRLLDFCGLEFEKSCLDFHTLKRAVPTASFAQVRKPIYKSSLDSWKHYEPYLGPLLDALGMQSTQSGPA